MEELNKKMRFEVKTHFDQIAGVHKRDVFVNSKLFEYEIDQESLQKAKQMGGAYYAAAQRDIHEHFLISLSDFVGREITAQDLMTAIETGWL
jgi:serine phosphatase RsbU (regulator of sigma subunit)